MNYDLIRVGLEKRLSRELYTLFEGDIVSEIIREAKVEAGQDELRSILEGHSFKITESMVPALHHLCNEVKEALRFEEPVEFFVMNRPELNCAARPRLEDDHAHLIMINSGILTHFDDDELRFVIGHELGHLISKNSDLSRIMSFVFPPNTKVPLLFTNKVELWQKVAELSADRYGFIASPNLDKCVSAFFKLASGLNTERISFDPGAYIEEMDRVLEYFRSESAPSDATHPVNPIRIKALQHFSKSDLYGAVAAGQELCEDASLAEKLAELLGILVSAGFSELDNHRRHFIAAGGIVVAGVDERLTQDEVERILGTLASVTSFPRGFLDQVLESKKVGEIFGGSTKALLEVNPGERYSMFAFLIDVALADRVLDQREVALLFDVGEKLFGFPRKEVAQQLGNAIQKGFVPRFSNPPEQQSDS